jgi:beta-glucuronidase
MKRLLFFVAGLIAAALAGGFYFLFRVFPRFDTKAFPAAAGAPGEDWKISTCGDVPFLIKNGLPFPSGFDSSNRPVQMLNGSWHMRLDPEDAGEGLHWERLEKAGKGWKRINIPSTFNAALSKIPDYQGPAWFFLKFVPSFEADDKHWQRICLEGVLIRSRVWLNGELISRHEGGWTPQYADISACVRPGVQNTLVIRADNRLTGVSLPPKLLKNHMPGWHPYGGVYRDVYIEKLPKDYIFKADYACRLTQNRALLKMNVLTQRPEKPYARKASREKGLSCTVSCGSRKIKVKASPEASQGPVVKYSFDIEIENPRLYSPDSPELYDVTLTYGSDRVSFKAGLRTIEVKGEEILLNGRKTFLKGISKHEDHPSLGASQTPEQIENDLNLIKNMGANYIRLAHYPHHRGELIKARDMGLMLAEEIPLYQAGTGFTAWYGEKRPLFEFPLRTFGNRQLQNSDLLLNAQRQLTEMIERDRLNPAIIMWGVANETYTLDKASAAVHGWLADTARMLDPARPVTMAEFTYGMPVLDDRRQTGRYMDVISINIYSGWYFGNMEDVSQKIEKVHGRFPGKPVIISECGAEAAPGRRDEDGLWVAERVPPGKTYSEDYQERLLEHYVTYAMKTGFVSGISPWVFADFFCPEFPGNPVPYYNSKGVVSKDRAPKKSYHMLKRLYHEDV